MLQDLRVNSWKGRQWAGVATVAVVVATGVGYGVWRSQIPTHSVAQAAEASPPRPITVTALGRLEPQGEVIQLSAPSNSGNRVEQVLVKEGDRVQAGQVIAILDNRDRLQAAYEQAQENVRVAEAQLAITRAGAKQGEIDAQRAEIDRLEAQRQGDIRAQEATVARFMAELQNAEIDFNRYQALYQEGAASAVDLDSRRLALDTARRSVEEARAVLIRIQSTSPAQLSQARARLEQIAEVRPVDVQAKQAEVNRAIAAMHQAKAELDQAYVRVPGDPAQSPEEFEVLEIHTHAGEVVSSHGIADIGKTQRMYAIAEVYQSDISRVKPGQSVRITSDSISSDLSGTVERIDSEVKRQTTVNTDPSTNIDARIVEVHIALDVPSSQRAAKFTNLQITAVIEQ
ncbi:MULTISPECIES: ABC exporter membrane fusion protein [unclassified Leptolyngbya]|uniref:ABC exporter membrane fusion protein n=1 Tax=unclassified Leptolyngbya TaxID=2650499 RepID=UPI001683D42B|nr:MULTISPECIES: ABC exporter membrane fusion protein [unclassified Leptolyngbya]MBD1909011.1 ABC exporter membrane fusion protein [Leptolyngbya sp. FACHB-8]MBD2158089.1 ABC exporter membrane fusion protein [Leptolyngbya sp. FACHB-16]